MKRNVLGVLFLILFFQLQLFSGVINRADANITSTQKTVTSFIQRLYKNILGRDADSAGLDYWVNSIENGSAEDVVMNFFNSPEFLDKNLSDNDFVDIAYKTILGRDADSVGLDYWTKELAKGTSRSNILYGFLQSDEFATLAKEYGVQATNNKNSVVNLNNGYGETGIDGFVNRFYVVVLGRNPDDVGFDYWVSKLSDKTKAGGDIAKDFFNSQEFKNQNFSNEEIIDTAYKAFFDREADEGGKTNWINFLEQGHSINEMLDGFIKSDEFINLAKKYGIKAYDGQQVKEDDSDSGEEADEEKYISTPLTKIKIPENYKQKLPEQITLDVPMILQNDGYSCATTSLAMVMSYYNNKIYDKNDVWNKSGSSIIDVTKICGNDMNGLMRAAKSFGFTNYEFVNNLNIDELKYLVSKDIPSIVNIKNFFYNSYHAVVVTGYDKEGFWINDPANSRYMKAYHIDYATFKNHWYAYLCSPTRGKHYNSAFILYKNNE